MASSATLKASTRSNLGSRAARKLRRAGQIPVHLLAGDGKPALDLAIDSVEFMTARRGHVHLFDLDLNLCALVGDVHIDKHV
jgi:ribosomal protein L25 (general stress protein Ctc)